MTKIKLYPLKMEDINNVSEEKENMMRIFNKTLSSLKNNSNETDKQKSNNLSEKSKKITKNKQNLKKNVSSNWNNYLSNVFSFFLLKY